MRRVLFCSVLTLCFCLSENGCSKGITRATAATVFFATGNVVFGNAERNDFQPVTSKSKIHAGDTVRTSVDAQTPVKIAAGYFSQWPTASKEPNAATVDASAQMDIKTALDVEPELLDQAAGWQNRRVF